MADETLKKPMDPLPEKPWQTERRWTKQDFYRGSKMPPFTIEPLPYERQRLAGDGMTPEDRALRKQWIKDQELSSNEPRYVKQLQPRNFFRRLYMTPTDAVFRQLIPVLGAAPASMCRVFIPRMFLILCGVYYSYYWLKYNPNDWTRVGGFNVYRNKPKVLYDGPVIEKKKDDFFDCGFKSRTVLRDGVTSTAP
ncbi:hypothetical protein BaRGS_00024674 [Batillaria attramentaria]|uniref:NADH dehydrogenase [ubiquinone] 1 beta subcomplex subunit 6 n=1 Tax=Batillaria attramentaria TaxID=370345 RepID=A0ABD0KAH8_9CAEN